MSNWKSCMSPNPQYEGATNQFCILSINVVPHQAVNCKVQVHYQNGVFANEFVTISGDEYKEWGADDNWIYHKIATKLALGVLADSDTPYVMAPVTDTNRSVHNETNLQQIQTLQAQLEAQSAQIKTITDMLIEKGLIPQPSQ